MHVIKNLARLGVVLATLGVIALTFARRASASAGMVPRPGGNGGLASPAPGWLIPAISAAVFAVLFTAIMIIRKG